MDKSASGWVWGNAPLAIFPLVAAAGVGIDAICGSWYILDPDTIDVALYPISPPLEKTVPATIVSTIATPSVAEDVSTSVTNSVDATSNDLDALLKEILENN